MDGNNVRFIFTRSLPVNDVEQAQIVSMLNGIVDKEKLLPQLSFLRDIPVEGGDSHAS